MNEQIGRNNEKKMSQRPNGYLCLALVRLYMLISWAWHIKSNLLYHHSGKGVKENLQVDDSFNCNYGQRNKIMTTYA